VVTLRASGDFQKQAGVLGNRDMGGETELFGPMRTIPVQFDNGRVFGLHALLEAGKGKPLSGSIPSIGTRGKATVGDKGPAVAIIAAFEQGFTCQFFIPGVAVDQRDSALLAGKFVVMQLIVFGIQQMNPGIDAMEASNLFLKRDELIPFLGVAGNGDAADGKFDAQLRSRRSFRSCQDWRVCGARRCGRLGRKEAWGNGNRANRVFLRGTRIRPKHECWTLGI